MVEPMKTALEEAQANLTHGQYRAQYQANKLRRDESYEAGDEVLLATRNLRIESIQSTSIYRQK